MKILVVTPFAETEWNWFGTGFGGGDYKWNFVNANLFGRKQQHWFIFALKISKEIQNNDIVISHGPYMSLYIALAMKLLRVKVRHYAFSFNHGNGRFFKGVLLLIARWVFPKVCGFVVFSKSERNIYSKKYNIPLQKMTFTPWAVNAPVINGEPPEYVVNSKPYASCVGRNNRDFNLFIEALRGTKYTGILICPSDVIDGKLLPSNIIMKNDVTMQEALHVMNNAHVNIIPILDASTGAGHMTIVSSMQLGKPLIVTHLETILDYFINGEHGILIDMGEVVELKNALSLLFSDCELRNNMGRHAKDFSKKWLSEEQARSFLTDYLDTIKNNKPLLREPVGWEVSNHHHV